ncbi:hypothetical protein B0T22DRAFT_490904 [Podospora appendiculata]|uniref:MYND-type domain-containing protein n=1 Tax=Podospora appendiculata TaxID=314037 RepID=A0AAE1CD88_9PEZI|nr:hypothetical protein B0T22DRAFT_490904 [Podospora appendiculata]
MLINLGHVTDVEDENYFPSEWKTLPTVDEYPPTHFWDDGSPKRHWCFLSEIVSATKNLLGYQVVVKDYCREEHITVLFPLDSGAADVLRLESFQAGHTLAVMNARRELLHNGTWGIHVERYQYPGVHIFPYTHDNTVAIAQALLLIASGIASCINCGDELKHGPPTRCCASCRLAQYCSPECQDSAWAYTGHINECVAYQDRALQALLTLDFTTYSGPFFFP